MPQMRIRRDSKFAKIDDSYKEAMQKIENDMRSRFEEISRKVYGTGFTV